MGINIFQGRRIYPNSKERKGYWMGVSHHVGDKHTYIIYCPDTTKVVSHSNVGSADPIKNGIINKRLDPDNPDELFDAHVNDSDNVNIPLPDSGEKMQPQNKNIKEGSEISETNVPDINQLKEKLDTISEEPEKKLTEESEHSGETKLNQNQDNKTYSGEKKLNQNQDKELGDSGECKTHKPLHINKQKGKKKRRYLIKGMTRDDYNEQMASILKHKKNLQPKAKRKKSKSSLRRSGRTPGKPDGISTRSSRYKPIIAKVTTESKEKIIKETKDETENLIDPNKKIKSILKRKGAKPNRLCAMIMAGIGASSIVFNTGGVIIPLIPNTGNGNNNNINNTEDYILETKISSPDKSLQFEAIKQLRKQLEIKDIIEDEDDEFWSFVPK